MPVVPSLGCWPPKSAKPRASEKGLSSQQKWSVKSAQGAHSRIVIGGWTRDPRDDQHCSSC
jgi:hypothetical protein